MRKEDYPMFEMSFEFSVKDLDDVKISEIKNIIKDIESYTINNPIIMDEKIVYQLSTTNFGDESYLISLLEDIPWFMKYVKAWLVNDNGLLSDMIVVEREMGQKCSYAS